MSTSRSAISGLRRVPQAQSSPPMPVTFYGDLNAGGKIRRAADIVLRRVNDVPGSTAAQRRWHIDRIEWKDGGLDAVVRRGGGLKHQFRRRGSLRDA